MKPKKHRKQTYLLFELTPHQCRLIADGLSLLWAHGRRTPTVDKLGVTFTAAGDWPATEELAK